jgi:type IV pilus assembly protein PilV
VTLDKKGFTLVEIMVAMVVLLVVLLGFMQGALVAIDSNMENTLRQEAVDVAMMRMNVARSTAVAALTSDAGNVVVNRSIANIPNFPFTTLLTVNATPAVNRKQVQVTVNWTWKGQPYTFSTQSIV